MLATVPRTPISATVTAGPLQLDLTGIPAPFAARLEARAEAPGIWLVALTLTADAPAAPPALALRWAAPCVDIHALWRGDSNANRGNFPPDFSWTSHFTARACSQAPVVCLYSQSGANRLTFASDDALHPTRLSSGVREESGEIVCTVEWFAGGLPPGTCFVMRLRLDLRDLPMEQTLAAVARWWETAYPPLAVPAVGREPMYSTWYAFHQAVDPTAVEAECRLARDLGCTAVIVDDGWQTLDGARGYAFCGDWEPERIPAMAEHVARVHALGMKFLLWYSVPFIGLRSRVHQRFIGKYLRVDEGLQTAVLDPRFPEVREYLIGVYERALVEWDLDGFKLDFVDAFSGPTVVLIEGRDIADIDEAVVRLLGDVMARLRARKPDILIEFRQSYVGPLMRTYGNLFRAGDCPNDALGNRVRTLDIRLLCGATACHADMLMWHPSDPVASAALQLLNVLFAVPQVSVLIAKLPADHRAMLRFWLDWWRAHRDCLLDGELSVFHPETGYSAASARTTQERIACAYSEAPIAIAADEPPSLWLVNATRGVGIVVELAAPLTRRLVVRDVLGVVIAERQLNLTAGLHRLPVPAAGLAELRA